MSNEAESAWSQRPLGLISTASHFAAELANNTVKLGPNAGRIYRTVGTAGQEKPAFPPPGRDPDRALGSVVTPLGVYCEREERFWRWKFQYWPQQPFPVILCPRFQISLSFSFSFFI